MIEWWMGIGAVAVGAVLGFVARTLMSRVQSQ